MTKLARWMTILASLALAFAGAGAATPPQTTHPATKHVAARPAHSRTSRSRSRSHARKRTTRRRRYRRRRRSSGRARLPKAPAPERITQIQSALSRGGYYKGDPNGKWDADTVAAVQKFQSAHNIDATGKLDAPTLQKLGLGSDIAGVGAPKPIVISAKPAAAGSAPLSPKPASGPAALPVSPVSTSLSVGTQGTQAADSGSGAASAGVKPAAGAKTPPAHPPVQQ